MITFNFSRSASFFESGIGRGMGFRDSNQDLVGFVHQIPSRARERIIDIASTQFPDGGCYHQYQPLTKRGNNDIGGGFNDDPMWLIFGTVAYIKETGDFSILDEMVPWDNEPGTEVSLFEHLRISFNHVVENLGPHALPLIGRADWNDCLNLNCFSEHSGESFQTSGPSEGPVAESVFIGGMFVKYAGEYADLCDLIGLKDEAAAMRKERDIMEKTLLTDGWDGKWFVRAYDAYSNKVGSHECEEGQIYIEPQGFCVLAGVGKETGEALQALNSVKDILDSKYGIALLKPAYTRYHVELGEVSSYPPGYKENGGIFCHNNPWFGEGKNSWLTGTAAWTFTDISQYILGVYPTLNGLSIDPCIPDDFGDFELTRAYREGVYHISVKNPGHVEKGVKKMIVDGKEVAGHVIPYNKGQKEYSVEVIMG